MEIKMGLILGGRTAVVGRVQVRPGDAVQAGETLLETESNKGVRPFKSPRSCTIDRVCCAEGDTVSTGDTLFEARPEAEETAEAGLEPVEEAVSADLLVVGGGPGGYVAALYAARQGLSTVLAEQGELGGTCLNRGCIPTKALLHCASAYREAGNAARFGVAAPGLSFDYGRMQAFKEETVDSLRGGVASLLDAAGVRVLHGRAELTGPKEAVVSAPDARWRVTAQHILLAVGSRPAPLKGVENLPASVMDSTAALARGTLPASVTIVGGGVIGMEFAFLYRALGVRVAVVEFTEHILPAMDEDVCMELTRAARRAGVSLFTGAAVTAVEEAGSGERVVRFTRGGRAECVVSEAVLVATGRRCDLSGLGLEAAGVVPGPGGGSIPVDGHMQTNVPGIYAAGDVTGGVQLAHAASHQGMLAVDHMLGRACPVGAEPVPSVVFTDPEAAVTGLSERDCAKGDLPCCVSRFPFSANGRAKTLGGSAGFVKLLQDPRSGKLLGAAVVGPDASALIAALTLAVRNGLTGEQVAKTIFAHPTTAEAVWEAALGFSTGALHYRDPARPV